MVKKRILFITLNVFLALVLCVGNIILWVLTTTVTEPEIIITPPNPYTAYCITTRKNERGVPIAQYDDKDCECFSQPTCQWENKFYYYSKMQSPPAVKDNRTLNVMGTEIQAEHYETSRFEYSTYLNDMYKADNGDTIGYKINSNILTYYYSENRTVKLSDELIITEEKLREVLDPLVESYVNISECEFSYYIGIYCEAQTFEELMEIGYSEIDPIYVTYQRYVSGIPTNEVLSFTLTLEGYLREFQLSGYGEFENLSEFNFDADTWSSIRDSKIRDMFVIYSEPEKLDRWERLAYVDGQYIMIVEIYEMDRNAENFTVRLAIPLTSAPENAPVTVIPEEKYEVPAVSLPIKITVTAISVIVLAVLIVVNISRKKSASSEQNENENEVL